MDDLNSSRAPDIFDRADDLRKEWRLTGTGPYAALPSTQAPDVPAAPGITPERRAAIHAKVLATIGDFEPMIGPAFTPEPTDQQLYDIAKRHMYDIGGSKAVNYLTFARELLESVAATLPAAPAPTDPTDLEHAMVEAFWAAYNDATATRSMPESTVIALRAAMRVAAVPVGHLIANEHATGGRRFVFGHDDNGMPLFAVLPTEQQDELPITRSTYGSLEACEAEQARRNAALAEQTVLPLMRAAFRTTVCSGGTTSREYTMVFRFPTLTALHDADEEWRAALAARPAPTEAPKLNQQQEETITMLRMWSEAGHRDLRLLNGDRFGVRALLAGFKAPDSRDAERLDWLEKNCTGASDSERYLPFRIYWGNKGATKGLRFVLDAAIDKEKAQ